MKAAPTEEQTPNIRLAPSILAADFGRLGEQVRQATEAGADYIHVDVMDGHFVPNITAGPVLVEAARKYTPLPLDVHLMIEGPERYLRAFMQAGASILTVHPETCPHLHRVVQAIKELGVRAGVALNPATPLHAIEEILYDVDLVLIMTVNPGFGGQEFIDGCLRKVERLRRRLDEEGLRVELAVDGGISPQTAPSAVRAGARLLVAGSAVFNRTHSVAEAMDALRQSVEGIRV